MLRFHRDSDGDPCAHGEKSLHHLADWLQSDVQGSAPLGRKILAAIDKVADGKLDEWERAGDAYTLTLSPEGAELEPDDDEPLQISLAELREALERWVHFVGHGSAG
jgi:uncharacterized protein YacL (UPF0231 family)